MKIKYRARDLKRALHDLSHPPPYLGGYRLIDMKRWLLGNPLRASVERRAAGYYLSSKGLKT